MPWPEWSLDRVLTERPAIRVNQVGYRPDGPKHATLVTKAHEPVPFTVAGRDGEVLLSAHSTPWQVRPEPTSGLDVHVLDLSSVTAPTRGATIASDGHRSHPFDISDAAYAGLAADALHFFTLQRSGSEVSDDEGHRWPAGHVGRPPNTGDVAVPAWQGPDAEALYPGWRQEGTFDVSGGWYDAGDYGKYVTSGSISLWQLLATLDLADRLPVRDEHLLAAIRAECRWQLDWMLRMQSPTGAQLAGMAFHRVHGTEWSPLPGWPHEDPTERVLHRPSTGATLHLAAGAAQGARLFRAEDPAYADRLLGAAWTAYRAAHDNPRVIAPDDQGRFGGGPYPDDDLEDDFYWAAAELWLATGSPDLGATMRESRLHRSDTFPLAGFDYDHVGAPAHLDLALLATNAEHDHVRETVVAAASALVEVQRGQPWGQPYAPDEGWDWGSNGRILNNLVVLAVAHLVTGDRGFRDAVLTGVDHLFGRNALGQSYVTGYGTDDTRHQRSRLFGHDHDPAFPPSPRGAIAGGANSRPHPGFYADPRLEGLPSQCCYLDEPTSEVTNDVCIRWNAPLVWIGVYLQ
jgi:endoglucanase